MMSRKKRELTPRERELIYMNMLRKIPLRETAVQLGVSYPTVQKWSNEEWVSELDKAVDAFVHSYLYREQIDRSIAER